MSGDGKLELVWGSGEQVFAYGIGQWRALQESVNRRRLAIGAPLVGPMDLLNAVKTNNAWPDDVRDIIRIGLIGGGMSPRDAHLELTQNFDGAPPLEHMKPALVILMAGLAGPPGAAEDGAKKKTPASRKADRSISG